MSVWDQTQRPAKMTISYNGIVLPGEWPPSHIGVGDDPLPVPYLSSPPAVVPVDVGRQLFVDDFLIERTTLKRVYHAAKVHEAAPVLSPETWLELNRGQCPVAAPFNDGAWYDPADGTFKLFYQAGWYDGVAMATSDDGIDWRRPRLAAVPGTNAVIPRPPGHLRDGVMVWLDHDAAPEERFKMFVYWRWIGHRQGGKVYTSPDGIRWAERGMASPSGDNTTFFHNPFRRKFVFSIRHKWQRRARSYHEHDDFLRASRWRDDEPVCWARTDRLDRPDPLVGIAPQLYDLNAVAYESLMLGAFAIFHGPENDRAAQLGRPKINDLQLAYSRDGFHWHRPHREAFIGASRRWGSWNYGYVHAAGGVCLVVGDELWFYYGAFSGQGSIFKPGEFGDYPHNNAMYAGGHTGLATLRRDGFASMETDGEGELVTRPLKFSGKCLFVNIDAAPGELRVEVADRRGIVIEPFSLANCRPLRADSTRERVEWNGGDLAALAGREVRFRFHLARGRLYAFWVSPSDRGVSRGFVAAGGPGYSGPVDE